MSGTATFSGTHYQSGVIAFVYAHLLAQRPLDWVHPIADVPQGVAGESSGIGDDIRIHLGPGAPALEVQVKHGLTAGAALASTVRDALARDRQGSDDLLALVVNRASTKSLYTHLAQDLERRRVGRDEPLRKVTAELFAKVPEVVAVCGRLYVASVDVDGRADAERKVAVQLIASSLEDPSQAEAAFAVFVADAQRLCAAKLSRTRGEVIDLLRAADIPVKPPAPSDVWHGRLDVTRSLIKTRHDEAALQQLAEIQEGIAHEEVEPKVRYRLLQHRAAAFLHLGKFDLAEHWARRAIVLADSDTTAIHILVHALVEQGRLKEAAGLAEGAVREAPEQEPGWIALAHVASTIGDPAPKPPQQVAMAIGYRFSELVNAAMQNNWDVVHRLSTELMREAECPPEVYVLRAHGIAARSAPSDRAAWADVDFLTTEALEKMRNDAHPLTPRALGLRAAARHRMGDPDGEMADLDQAKRLAPDTPELIAQVANALAREGQSAAALQVLGHPVVASSSYLLAQRAALLAATDVTRAASDLERSVEALPSESDPVGARLCIADSAFLLDRNDLAEEMLDGLPEGGTTYEFPRRVLMARLSAQRGDFPAAIQMFTHAAELQPEHRPALMTELASHLGADNRFAEVVAVLTDQPLGDLPEAGRRMLVAALLEMRDMGRAAAVLETEGERSGVMPVWGIRASVEIALQQDDPDTAIKGLGDLLTTDEGNVQARSELVRQLLEHGRIADATPHVSWLTAQGDLTPSQQMFIAHALFDMEREEEALRLGVRALRSSPADPRLHRELVVLSLKARLAPEVPFKVGADTHVKCVGAEGQSREFTIWSDLPRDMLRYEISVDEAAKLGLLGLERGATVVLNRGDPREEVFEVAQIQTAEAFLIGDTIRRYEERFPTEPFFVTRVPIGDLGTPDAFSEVFAIASRRAEWVARLIEAYRDSCVPLGLLAAKLTTTTADLLTTLGTSERGAGRVYVQWPDAATRAGALEAARAAASIVLAPTAICTLHDLGILEAVLAQYTVLVAESASREVESWAREAEAQAQDGVSTLGVQEDGRPFIVQFEGGADPLRRRAAHFRDRCNQLQSASCRPRPLDSITSPGSEEDEQRRMLGAPSYDSVRLAVANRIPLCADDLGLRILMQSQLGAPSLCTVDLIQVLAEDQLLSLPEYHKAMSEIAGRGFAFMPPKPGTLVWAAGNTELDSATIRRVFEGLTHDGVALAAAAETVAQAAREAALAAVQLTTPRFIVAESIAVMTVRWPQRAVVAKVREACLRTLQLLPTILAEVESAITSLPGTNA